MCAKYITHFSPSYKLLLNKISPCITVSNVLISLMSWEANFYSGYVIAFPCNHNVIFLTPKGSRIRACYANCMWHFVLATWAIKYSKSIEFPNVSIRSIVLSPCSCTLFLGINPEMGFCFPRNFVIQSFIEDMWKLILLSGKRLVFSRTEKFADIHAKSNINIQGIWRKALNHFYWILTNQNPKETSKTSRCLTR